MGSTEVWQFSPVTDDHISDCLALSAEADWKRRGLYMGPKFSNLDETVQSDFEAFIEERGLNTSLALFVPDLAEWKEQKEYTTWLKNVKAFVEA